MLEIMYPPPPCGERREVRTTRRGRIAALGTALAATLALGGCASGLMPPRADTAAPHRAQPANEPIGILDEGWHTGLVLPKSDLHGRLAALQQDFPRARDLAFGWGDRAYYMAAHPSWATGLRALFPSPSVLFVHGLPSNPVRALPAGATLRWLCASSMQTRRLDTFLAHYVARRPAGQPLRLQGGAWPHSAFFASTGHYAAFHTCNTWTAAALAFAGFPVDGTGVVFAGQVMAQVRHLRTCRG